MTLEELQAEATGILALEERPIVDWPEVKAPCLAVISQLHGEPQPAYPQDVVYHFLDDPDIRQKDFGYGERQRRKLRARLPESE